MTLDTQNLGLGYSFKIPKIINDLVSNDNLKALMPVRFILKKHAFNLDIQYFLDVAEVKNQDVSNAKIRFAVTTDGFDLLVNINSDNLDIMQDEFGNIDTLGVSIMDLIEADKKSL